MAWGKAHKGSDEELPFSCCLPISMTIYSQGGLIIARSDLIKRVWTFLKNCSIVCFIPDDGVPCGFFIIVLGSYQIPMASRSLYCNIHIL
ncbi:MAG: hypothetical protein JRJ00_17680 [Deltaproteobacteria bacterium]|nr:hypothetical protein [Deltaproteobacteria bacterium]